jgi:hypothetical protein
VLPKSVSEAFDIYFELLSSERVAFVRGFYLLGSVALGDYQEGRSDIDFAALTDGPLDGERANRLERVHHAMIRLKGPSFDGFYLESYRLQQTPSSTELACFSLDGSFHREKPCFEINPVTWALWSQHGIALHGPSPSNLGIAIDQHALRAFQVANLHSYWLVRVTRAASHLAQKSAEDTIDASLLAWGVLGVARIACTLATGRIVSKSEAGMWALERYRRDGRVFISDALAARRGETINVSVDHFGGALKFVRDVIADAGGTLR